MVDFVSSMEIRENIRRIELKVDGLATNNAEGRRLLRMLIAGWKSVLAEKLKQAV